MKTLTRNFVAQTLNLCLSPRDYPINRVVIDSRQAQAGDLFVALVGEKHDAHDFVPQVLEKGALALVSREDAYFSGSDDEFRVLKVADTLTALQNLSSAWRAEINPFVFAITGSSGKTTVKEMLAAILRQAFGADKVWATQGNLNNHIGLPLTLLNLREQHRYAVIEMGMNHFGELAQLTQLTKPDVALVNNAMRAHIGCGFNGVDDIARAKSEIYQGLSEQGWACLPIEDSQFAILEQAVPTNNRRTFGMHQGDVHAENIVLKESHSEFDLVLHHTRLPIQLPVLGKHNIANACAAACLASLLEGVQPQDIAQALANFSNIKGRLQIKTGKQGSKILDDTYNANPDSMKAALDVLAQMPQPRIFIMGDMGELGEDTAAIMHEEIGQYARDLGIEQAYFVGDNSVYAAEKFGATGLWFADKDPLIQVMLHELPNHAHILVKGSRFMQMEEVVNALVV